jgi:hypothetical protein
MAVIVADLQHRCCSTPESYACTLRSRQRRDARSSPRRERTSSNGDESSVGIPDDTRGPREGRTGLRNLNSSASTL